MDLRFDMIKTLGKAFLEEFSASLNKNLELDELAEFMGDELDKIIINYQAEGATFCAGKMFINAKQPAHFTISFELWFKKNEKWQKLANESAPKDLAQLSAQARDQLLSKGSISYTVTEPQSFAKS